jgi:hypothetical protein
MALRAERRITKVVRMWMKLAPGEVLRRWRGYFHVLEGVILVGDDGMYKGELLRVFGEEER